MNTGWDHFQELLKAQVRKKFSEEFTEHSMNPRNLGGLDGANAFARVTKRSHTLQIWLKVENDRIVDASFNASGCGADIACGSLTTELAIGKTLEEAYSITPEIINNKIGGLPTDHMSSAELASLTLRRAIVEHRRQQKAKKRS